MASRPPSNDNKISVPSLASDIQNFIAHTRLQQLHIAAAIDDVPRHLCLCWPAQSSSNIEGDPMLLRHMIHPISLRALRRRHCQCGNETYSEQQKPRSENLASMPMPLANGLAQSYHALHLFSRSCCWTSGMMMGRPCKSCTCNLVFIK